MWKHGALSLNHYFGFLSNEFPSETLRIKIHILDTLFSLFIRQDLVSALIVFPSNRRKK